MGDSAREEVFAETPFYSGYLIPKPKSQLTDSRGFVIINLVVWHANAVDLKL